MVANAQSAHPCPMQVESSSVSVHVQNLSGEEEAGYDARLHGRRIDLADVHAACGYFGVFEAVCGGDGDAEVLEGVDELGDLFATEICFALGGASRLVEEDGDELFGEDGMEPEGEWTVGLVVDATQQKLAELFFGMVGEKVELDGGVGIASKHTARLAAQVEDGQSADTVGGKEDITCATDRGLSVANERRTSTELDPAVRRSHGASDSSCTRAG